MLQIISIKYKRPAAPPLFVTENKTVLIPVVKKGSKLQFFSVPGKYDAPWHPVFCPFIVALQKSSQAILKVPANGTPGIPI